MLLFDNGSKTYIWLDAKNQQIRNKFGRMRFYAWLYKYHLVG